ncbi:MAG TPA: hypothetical protein VIZ58_01555, partial [Thermoanaerobaculia bacterium]
SIRMAIEAGPVGFARAGAPSPGAGDVLAPVPPRREAGGRGADAAARGLTAREGTGAGAGARVAR